MDKYPVTSKRGNTYHVEVNKSRYYVDHYEVGIYQKYKGWFNRDKYHLVNQGFMGQLRSYDASEYGFDLILMVKSIVNNMEDKWEEIENKEKLLKDKEVDFENWDGNC